MSLSETEQAKVTELTLLGLPEEAAVECAKAITAGPNPAGKPAQVYGRMNVKEGADVAALTAAVKEYGDKSAAAPGQLGCSYSIADGALVMFETFDSINAMHIHVGHCFPASRRYFPTARWTRSSRRVILVSLSSGQRSATPGKQRPQNATLHFSQHRV